MSDMNDQNIHSVFENLNPENPEVVLLKEGLQALYRERLNAFHVASSLEGKFASVSGRDFELPQIQSAIRKAGMLPMPQPL